MGTRQSTTKPRETRINFQCVFKIERTCESVAKHHAEVRALPQKSIRTIDSGATRQSQLDIVSSLRVDPVLCHRNYEYISSTSCWKCSFFRKSATRANPPQAVGF